MFIIQKKIVGPERLLPDLDAGLVPRIHMVVYSTMKKISGYVTYLSGL